MADRTLCCAAESQFQLHHFGHTFWLDLTTCVLILLYNLINVIKAAVLSKSTIYFSNIWITWVLPAVVLVHMLLLGRARYIRYRGMLSIGSRMLFSFGLASNSCPTGCKWCMVLWRHRFVLTSWGHVLGSVNAYFYWVGAAAGWLVADLSDAADPAGMCGHSLNCKADAVRDVVASAAVTARSNPSNLAMQILASISSRNSLYHLADVLLPGLVLTYLEYKARRPRQMLQRYSSSSQLQCRFTWTARRLLLVGSVTLVLTVSLELSNMQTPAPPVGIFQGVQLFQELELRFLYLSSPMLGGWLEDLSGVTELRSLRVLRLAGAPCPPPSFFADLSFLRNLSTLEYLPGGYSQVSAADTSLEGLHGLAAHGLLPNLEQLALYDLELPSECLSDTLAGATALTTLQNLSLDTVALPDLRDLVLSAARGSIPSKGPGAITGLCLLDQPLAGAPHLASLSQLSSLQGGLGRRQYMRVPGCQQQEVCGTRGQTHVRIEIKFHYSSSSSNASDRLAQHFSSLQALWLEHVQLPFNLLPAALPSAAGTLESLALLHVAGTTAADLVVVSSLTCLTSLRLLPEDHALEGLAHLTALRHLRKLNVRLTHLQPSDLAVLSQLRSLFCLSLSAPLADGELLPGFPSAVRINSVVDLVHHSLPYCDVELLGDPTINQAM
eukprot:gene6501-6729_t